MIVPANILLGLADTLGLVLNLYKWVVIAAVVVSWVNADPANPVVAVLRRLTEPLFARLRRMLPFLVAGGIDFSPLVVLLGIFFLEIAAVGSLRDFANSMR